MDGNQRNRLAVAPLEQLNGHLHQSVRSRAPPRSWCTPPSLHCRTSISPLGTSAEVGSLSQHRWQPASPERLCGTIVEMLTTVPVSSVSLTGLPSPNWTHLWRELLPSLWWRGVDLAGLLGMTTMPPLTEPTVELESGQTSSRSSGNMLWRPTIGLEEDGAVLAGPAKPWTPACREACADLWQLCSDWLSSADELTGPLNAFWVGAPLWNVECWTASRWTGSLDLEWGRTSRSWWSSQETGALWWLSGRAVELVLEYLLWSASRLSRRVASHLAALTATRRVSAALWTPVEKSPVQTEGKWTGTPSCWPRNADTCGQPDALVHEDRHPVCLSTPSTPDFWWQIGRTLVSPSWSAVPPCGGWEWTGRLQGVDLLSSWEPETTDCRIPGTSRWWLALWLPSSARHRRLAEDPVGCSWSGNWCFDGWAEVVAGMQGPPRPRRCRWPGSCPADSASAVQSLPGTRQRCLVEVAEEALPDFLLPWKDRGRVLPAPARKSGSCVTVLVVEVGDPRRSNTEGLGAVFLDDVTFLLGLDSRCLGRNVRDEPVITSACLMARTRFWRTFASGPTQLYPSNGAVPTAARTWGWKLKFFRRASRRSLEGITVNLETVRFPGENLLDREELEGREVWVQSLRQCSLDHFIFFKPLCYTNRRSHGVLQRRLV